MDMKKRNAVVTTISGKEVDRKDARLINGNFYEVNKDCFIVEGSEKWQRIDNGKIAYDYENSKYAFIQLLESAGYVKGFADSEEVVYFRDSPYDTVSVFPSFKRGSPVFCRNKDIALKLGYVEHLGTGNYYKKANLTLSELKNCNKKSINFYDDKKINYNANEHSSTFIETVRSYNSRDNVINIDERTRLVSKILGNYSFGFEFETSDGFVPSRICNKLGLVPLKDGSLRHNGKEPYEYTTIPLSGERGLETLKSICKELTDRCEFSQQCSLHLHVGLDTFGTNMEFLIALYILSYKLQGEFFNMFPDYKKDPQKHLGTEKNYCKGLKSLGLLSNDIYHSTNTKEDISNKILENFNKIFAFLCDNQVQVMDSKYNLHTFRHPQGETKWNRNSRYYHINFMNTVFSPTRTVEFRLHTPTFSFVKSSNWLFICVAMIRYAKQYTKEITSRSIEPTLTSVLQGYYNFFGELKQIDPNSKEIADYLVAYCNFRKESMKEASLKADIMGRTIEFEGDKNFEFSNGILKSIY